MKRKESPSSQVINGPDRLEGLAGRAPCGDALPGALAFGPSIEPSSAKRARSAALGIDPVIVGCQFASCRILRATTGIRSNERRTKADQVVEATHGSDHLIGRHADNERDLDGVQISKASDVTLIQQSRGERNVWDPQKAIGDLLHVRCLVGAQVRPQVPDQRMFLRCG